MNYFNLKVSIIMALMLTLLQCQAKSKESTNIENAKLFKEDLLKRNVKNSTTLNL